jgi:aspartate carbamoyltransferase catalytic subunit
MLKHLISTQNIDKNTASSIFKEATRLASSESETKVERSFSQKLYGKTVAMLFYESSTRTKASFVMAAQKLGANVLDIDPKTSSVNKGESLDDTAKTLTNLGVDVVVIRHSSSGAALRLVNCLAKTKIAVINAGDGMNEHPTQALLDLFSMQQEVESIEGKTVLILGDSLHSRVAKSNIYLLVTHGARVVLCGPPSLAPQQFAGFMDACVSDHSQRNKLVVLNNLDDLQSSGLAKEINFVMVLRLQKERQSKGLISGLSEYKRYFSLDEKFFKTFSQPDLKVLHPGPVNRGVEISDELVDNENVSLVGKQVSNGLHIRMAILSLILGNNNGKR